MDVPGPGWRLISLRAALERLVPRPQGPLQVATWPTAGPSADGEIRKFVNKVWICWSLSRLGPRGLYRISDDKGQLPEGAILEGHSLDLALGWFCCNLVSSVERQIVFLWHWNWSQSLSSYSLPIALLHASSILLAQL